MGSPLGPLFANFYMGTVEERVFSSTPPPLKYCRYIDDAFVAVSSEEQLNQLVQGFKSNSVLNFTVEKSVNGKLPYLDVLLSTDDKGLSTSVYRKNTNIGLCLNAQSECPRRYKISVIDSFINRALTHCSTWPLVTEELEKSSQILVNNGYSNKDIQSRIRLILNRHFSDNVKNQEDNKIKLYYRGFFHKNSHTDERNLHRIIADNVLPEDESSKVDLVIYYKNMKTSNLLIRNSPPRPPAIKEHGVVYLFRCPVEGCSHSYVGMTTTVLSKRLSCHLQEGAIYNHFIDKHNENISRELIVASTEIIDTVSDFTRLRFLEAIHILSLKPSLNTTNETLILPTCRQRPLTPS